MPDEREADLESWLRAVKLEYVCGDLTLEEFEAEVWHYLCVYEGQRPLVEPTPPPPTPGALDWAGA